MRLCCEKEVCQTLLSSIRSNDRRGLVTNLVPRLVPFMTLEGLSRYRFRR